MTSRTRTTLLAAAAVAALGLGACGSGDDAPSATAADGTRTVSLMLNWYPYGEHAPFYYGVQEGIFAKHGIDLQIKAGQGSTKTVQAVGSDQVDFGWADTPAVLANIDKGVGVKSVGVFLQTTPSSVQVFSDSGISSPADLAGHTIAVSAGDAPTVMFPTYLKMAGVDEGAVKTQNLDPAGKIAAVLTDKVDGLIGFAHDQGPTIAAKSGKEMTYLRYSDVGLNYFSTGLIAPQGTLDDDAALVKELVAATSEAFAAAEQQPEAAVQAMSGKDPQMPADDVLLEQWKQTSELLHTDATEGDAPGVNATADWESTLKVLSDAGLVAAGKSVDTYFDASAQPQG
ncbi:ABC transporter substrate-binding protein [Phycicoccus sp. DTK01]|uniref:ABC transporter substrate-binding protein n=1 Tax=Phycicoccus sp. DTK01 TaxID=2785745 RepID=UPI001A8CB5F5|nr:ABC transporter substrate-binding protein [Phycicoccus sp. DTK01]GIL36696.1 sulfonate ABC transporter substrate-binding protein [Phycicoccus sp. DTK01]